MQGKGMGVSVERKEYIKQLFYWTNDNSLRSLAQLESKINGSWIQGGCRGSDAQAFVQRG